MKRFSTLSLALAVAAFTVITATSFAQNGVPAGNTASTTFIDENGDGICDTYQAGGQGQGLGQGNKAGKQGNGVADGSQAKTQQRLKDGSGAGGAYGQGTNVGTGNQGRTGKGRGKK